MGNLTIWVWLGYYTPRFNEVESGLYRFHLVHLSVCPSVDRIVSALYIQQYSSDPFHICTSYQATSEGVSHVMFVSKFKKLKFWWNVSICNFDFVFWLGIQYDSIVWVIMRRRGYPQNAGVLVQSVCIIVLYKMLYDITSSQGSGEWASWAGSGLALISSRPSQNSGASRDFGVGPEFGATRKKDHSQKLVSMLVCQWRRSSHMTRSLAWLIPHVF